MNRVDSAYAESALFLPILNTEIFYEQVILILNQTIDKFPQI